MRKQSVSEWWRISALALLLPAATLLSSPVNAQISNFANHVGNFHITHDAVDTAQIADDAVGSAKIAENSVGTSHIADGAVGTDQLANNSLDLFANLYAGRPQGTERGLYYTYSLGTTPGFVPNSVPVPGLGCFFVLEPAPVLVTEWNCDFTVHAPFNGSGTFNANRVLEENAINNDKLRTLAIGYQNYYHNAYNGGLDLGDSHYADNGLNSGLIADDGIAAAHLTGGAVSAFFDNKVNSDTLTTNAVETAGLVDNAVTTAKLVDDLISTAKLADGAVTIATIADDGVTRTKLAAGFATTATIADSAITTAKLLNGVVTTDKIVNKAVTIAQLADGAVTSGKFADGAVNAAKLADGAATTNKLADASVTTNKIQDNAVTSDKIVAAAVTTRKLANISITTATIADSAVTTAKLVDSAVTARKLADGAVTSAKMVDAVVITAKLADGAVTAAKFADGAVTSAKIVDSAVTSAKIADRTIAGVDIASGTITYAHLVDGAVVSDSILDASVGIVELDIKLVSDFDLIGRTGQHSVTDAKAVAQGFANVGLLTTSTGVVLDSLTPEDQFRIARIIEDFTTAGVVASGSQYFSRLSSGVARHVASLLNGGALAQQEIGGRGDLVGSDWTSSSLRAQTRWLRDRGPELGARIDFTHQNLDRIGAELDALNRGVAMAGAITGPVVQEGRRGTYDMSITEFGDAEGLSMGFGIRLSDSAQINFATASTPGFDENIMRFGALIQLE